MPSLSTKISLKLLVPRTFLSVVCANSFVERVASSTLTTDEIGF